MQGSLWSTADVMGAIRARQAGTPGQFEALKALKGFTTGD